MNDSDLLDRLQRIDPLRDGVRITPAHSAQALTLMESIMTTESKSSSTDRVTSSRTAIETNHTRRPTRQRWSATLGLSAAAAAVAAAIVLPGIGGSSAAMAWTPTPRAATAADGDAARQACVVPESTASQSVDAGSRSGDTEAPAAPAPVELGSLAALDLRGNGGLAVFTSDEGTVMCMLRLVDGEAEYAGMVITGAPAQPLDTLVVEGGMTTGVDTSTAVSMLFGQAGPAARVEINVPGLEPVTATLTDGQFAAWWPEQDPNGRSSLDGSITIRSYAADGTELDETIWTGARDETDAQRSVTP